MILFWYYSDEDSDSDLEDQDKTDSVSRLFSAARYALICAKKYYLVN